jgi:hypothetical protein
MLRPRRPLHLLQPRKPNRVRKRTNHPHPPPPSPPPQIVLTLAGYLLIFLSRLVVIALFLLLLAAVRSRSTAAFARTKRLLTLLLLLSILPTLAAAAALFALPARNLPQPQLLEARAAIIIFNESLCLALFSGLALLIRRRLAKATPSPVASLSSWRRVREVRVMALCGALSALSFLLRIAQNAAELSGPAARNAMFGANRFWFIPVFYVVVEVVPVTLLLAALTYVVAVLGVGGEDSATLLRTSSMRASGVAAAALLGGGTGAASPI